jgi:hypothetical protein
MKKIILLFIMIVTLSLVSCSDFMEFPPAAQFNVDSVFTKYANAERLLSDMYSYPIPLNIDTRPFGAKGTRLAGGAFASALTDEGQPTSAQAGYLINRYHRGTINALSCASWDIGSGGEDDYLEKWKTIRKAYILLNNIDRVPNSTFPINQGLDPQVQKDRIKAEAKLMIALVYFEMWKRYGGVPLLNREFRSTDDFSSFAVKRSTLEETYDFITGLLDDVTKNYEGKLPAKITVPAEYGRFPMALAYGLRARLELYAASPLYNTNVPYSNALGANSNLICFMKPYDPQRWKKAADAATAAINYCNSNGYAIVDDPSKRDNGMNYTVASLERPSMGNNESIWGINLPKLTSSGYNTMQAYTIIRGSISGTFGFASNLVPLNQIERYEKKTSVSGQYQSWDAIRTFPVPTIPTGTAANTVGQLVATAASKAYEGLDPRFYASISYNGVATTTAAANGAPLYGSQPFIDMGNGYVENFGTSGFVIDKTRSGNQSIDKQAAAIMPHYVRKFTRGFEGRESTLNTINIYMRLAELYLIRAEALNEFGENQAQVENDLNSIRTRSGMPNVVSGQSKIQMRETIAHERSVELFYEDHRWFDLRRTLQSEFKIPVNIYNVSIKKWYKRTSATAISPNPYQITYEKTLYNKRVWYNHWYMNPFPAQEVNKGYGLIQNPGW